MQRITFPLTFIFIFLAALMGCKENIVPIRSANELDQLLQNTYNKSDIAGYAVSVVKDGQIKFQKSYGYADIMEERPYSLQTSQKIGSISKLFIGVALMKVIEEGHFTLETKINDILPFEVHNPYSQDTPILVKHLVTHTSGIIDNETTYLNMYSIPDGEDLTTPIAKRLIKELNPMLHGEILSFNEFFNEYLLPSGLYYNEDNFINSPAGSTYAYSNIASCLAAYIIEIKTQKTFDEYTKEVIFDPLEMNHSAWKEEQLQQNLVSHHYFDKNNVFPSYTHTCYPDGGLITSIEDLTLFMLEMMKAKQGQSELLLSSKGYETLFKKLLDTIPEGMVEKEDNYGVFFVWSTSGRIGHSGGDIGVLALFGFNPEKQTGSILLVNTEVEENVNENISESISRIVQAYRSFEDF